MNTSLGRVVTTGCGRKVTIAEIVKMYRDIIGVSIPESGRIHRLGSDMYSLKIQSQAIDLDTMDQVKTFKIHTLQTKTADSETSFQSVMCASDVYQIGDIMTATSLNGRYLARLKSKDNATSKSQLLEIWDRSKLIKTIDTANLDVHGAINVDSTFGNFVWSPFDDQDKLLYVCQPKRPKYVSFFKESQTGNDSDINRGEEYIRRKDWGECLNGIEHTMIGILDVVDNCSIITINMNGYSLGDPHWLDNGRKIVSVAYKEEPRLGIIYCNNKESKIVIHEYRLDKIDKPTQEIGNELESYHTPRVNHRGDQFIYLSNLSHGAHKHANKINLYDLKTQESRELSDKEGSSLELFVTGMPKTCFTTDDKLLVFVAESGLTANINIYDLERSRLNVDRPGSILDFRDNIILKLSSRIISTPEVSVAVLDLDDSSKVLEWHQVESGSRIHGVRYDTAKISVENDKEISAVLIEPDLLKASYRDELPSKDQRKLPTIVLIHGGPNSAYTLIYLPALVFYAHLGFKTLIVNYRGSTGVDEEYVQSLCGKVSEYDVSDCLTAIEHFKKEGRIDSDRLILAGGSHGGFIAAHLSCISEIDFLSAVIRNPVIDLPSLRASSDIPEWGLNVALGHKRYDQSHALTREELLELYEKSPSSKMDKARVPTLMLLGKNDRRVNMYQGELWVDNLRARGIEALCKVYDDKHSLDKPETLGDVAITSVIWMLDHLPK